MDIKKFDEAKKMEHSIMRIEKICRYLKKISNGEESVSSISIETKDNLGRNPSMSIVKDFPLGHDVHKDFAPAEETIRQSIEFAINILDNGIAKAYAHIKKTF